MKRSHIIILVSVVAAVLVAAAAIVTTIVVVNAQRKHAECVAVSLTKGSLEDQLWYQSVFCD